jgi:hypothetical protein
LTTRRGEEAPGGPVDHATSDTSHDPATVSVCVGQRFATEVRVKATERATRAELRTLGADPTRSALAQAAVDLARRLDAGPGDRAAAMLVRELRLVVGDLRRSHGGDLGSELERFLGQVDTPAFRGPGD